MQLDAQHMRVNSFKCQEDAIGKKTVTLMHERNVALLHDNPANY
jgi:hypothetical protein